MVAFKSMFPEVAEVIMPPSLTGRAHLPRSPLTTLRRQQLSDICVAFGLDVNRDATKDELLSVVLGAEQQGKFNKPAKDPYRLTKASKSPDEWRSLRDGGGTMPPFEEPDEEKASNNSIQMLKARAKQAGVNTFQMSKADVIAALEKAEGKAAE